MDCVIAFYEKPCCPPFGKLCGVGHSKGSDPIFGQADLLLEFTIVLLDPVAALDVPDEVLERRVGRQRTEPEAPVLGSLGVLNDQPFLGIEVVTALSRSDLNPARREPPAQLSGRSFAPRDGGAAPTRWPGHRPGPRPPGP